MLFFSKNEGEEFPPKILEFDTVVLGTCVVNCFCNSASCSFKSAFSFSKDICVVNRSYDFASFFSKNAHLSRSNFFCSAIAASVSSLTATPSTSGTNPSQPHSV